MAKLTAKQKRFCDEYLIDLNATQAAIRAGYSQKTANEQGARLLANVSIQEYLSKRMHEREKRTEISQDSVLKELANIAFANGSDFAMVKTKVLRPAILDYDGEVIEKAIVHQVVELQDTEGLPKEKLAAISCIRETKFGIAVETCDKVRALELLGKHLGMFKDKLEVSGELVIIKGDGALED